MSKDQLAAGQASPASDCSGTIKQTIYPHGGSRIWMEYPDGTVELMADTYDGEDLAKKVRATIEAHFFPNAEAQGRPPLGEDVP